MSGIAAVIDWSGADARAIEARARAMLDRIPHRATEGCALALGADWALGYARHETARLGRAKNQPLRIAGRALWIAADARLDNRDDFSRLLDRRPTGGTEISDAELLLFGYARWGKKLAERLEGDFAFVIYDADQKEVYAARDPFGAKPLFFRCTNERLHLASEVGQIMALDVLDGFSREIEPEVVLDYLLDYHRSLRETFFRGVERIPAGHHLFASRRSKEVAAYYLPPDRSDISRPIDQCKCDTEFRDRLGRSVAARLDASHPVLAELSGGLDSSSIVCLADQLAGQDASLPQVSLLSVLFSSLDCDESAFIDAVERCVRFETARYDASDSAFDGSIPFEVSHPWRNLLSGVIAWEERVAEASGARVLLSGIGGDELLFERGIYRDLVERGLWGRLAVESFSANYSGAGTAFRLREALKALAPRPLLLRQRRLRRKPAPAWLGPELRPLHARLIEEDRAQMSDAPLTHRRFTHDRPFESHTQAWNWAWVTSPGLAWDIEYDELDLARRGLEKRYPFLDKRLVDLVVGLPFSLRLPGGRMKVLLRRALGSVLPAVIRERVHAIAGNAVVERHVAQRLPFLREVILSGEPWESAPYVTRASAKAALARIESGKISSDWRASNWLWDVSALETWLRTLRANSAMLGHSASNTITKSNASAVARPG